MLAKIARMFADHYQLHIYDSNYDHYNDPRLQWNDTNRGEFGYLATERAIYVSTVADLNDHRMRVYLNQLPSTEYERVFVRELVVTSGILVFSGIADTEDEKVRVSLEPGKHRIHVCGNSIGKDEYSYDIDAQDLSNDEYFKHDEFEYYDIFVNPAQ